MSNINPNYKGKNYDPNYNKNRNQNQGNRNQGNRNNNNSQGNKNFGNRNQPSTKKPSRARYNGSMFGGGLKSLMNDKPSEEVVKNTSFGPKMNSVPVMDTEQSSERKGYQRFDSLSKEYTPIKRPVNYDMGNDYQDDYFDDNYEGDPYYEDDYDDDEDDDYDYDYPEYDDDYDDPRFIEREATPMDLDLIFNWRWLGDPNISDEDKMFFIYDNMTFIADDVRECYKNKKSMLFDSIEDMYIKWNDPYLASYIRDIYTTDFISGNGQIPRIPDVIIYLFSDFLCTNLYDSSRIQELTNLSVRDIDKCKMIYIRMVHDKSQPILRDLEIYMKYFQDRKSSIGIGATLLSYENMPAVMYKARCADVLELLQECLTPDVTGDVVANIIRILSRGNLPRFVLYTMLQHNDIYDKLSKPEQDIWKIINEAVVNILEKHLQISDRKTTIYKYLLNKKNVERRVDLTGIISDELTEFKNIRSDATACKKMLEDKGVTIE